MIKPELLRIHPVFSSLTQAQLKAVAGISTEETYESGEIIFKEGSPADALCLLLTGSIEMFFTIDIEQQPKFYKEFTFGTINPADLFEISALIPPHILTSSGRAVKPCRIIRIDGESLRQLCAQDQKLAYKLVNQVSKLAVQRLNNTRIHLAAATISA